MSFKLYNDTILDSVCQMGLFTKNAQLAFGVKKVRGVRFAALQTACRPAGRQISLLSGIGICSPQKNNLPFCRYQNRQIFFSASSAMGKTRSKPRFPCAPDRKSRYLAEYGNRTRASSLGSLRTTTILIPRESVQKVASASLKTKF